MSAKRFYAMIGDMHQEQEFYCAQPIYAEFVLAHEFEDAKALNNELLEALTACQWGARSMGVPACPQCGNDRASGHNPKCIVGLAIAKAKGAA